MVVMDRGEPSGSMMGAGGGIRRSRRDEREPMTDRRTPVLGRHLLDRRGFLADMATGVGSIALGALLAEDGLLADDRLSGPSAASKPAGGALAPKAPHFPARAKRVLHLFCTGAVSHLDTWDYKPALWKRDGQPMPGVDKLITFQGENGNLARSPWAFRQRGQSGKWVSDL